MLQNLGALLRSIHDIDQSRLLGSELIPGDKSPSDLRQRFSDSFSRLADALESDQIWRGDLDIRLIGEQQIDQLPTDTGPVALHSNPGPEHVFVDPSTGKFTGIIDFGDAYRSHPALDLRPWRQSADIADALNGYQGSGPLRPGFQQVVTTGLIMAELGQVARGRQDAQSAAIRVRELSRSSQ